MEGTRFLAKPRAIGRAPAPVGLALVGISGVQHAITKTEQNLQNTRGNIM
jgi:hypothetical protein